MSFFETVAADDVTLHGLEKWTCHMYEQLGWITIAYESGNGDKVSAYIISIKKLKYSIESRLKIITSEDAKLDLDNLLSKVNHLIKISSNLFDKERVKKTICDKCTRVIGKNYNNLTNTNLKKNIKPSKEKKLKTSKIQNKTMSKTDHLNSLSKLAKKTSKKSSKKLSKNLFKKSSKKSSKK